MADDPPATLLKTLHNIAEEKEYSDYHLTIKPISTGGANFTSSLFKITLSSKNKSDIKLFAKLAVLNKDIRDHIPIPIFDTEEFFYKELYHIYEQYQRDFNIPNEYRFISPQFYLIDTKLMEEILVLEDLTARGYTALDRQGTIDWKFASAAVTQLAYFHALSRVHAELNPDAFQKMAIELKRNAKALEIMSSRYDVLSKMSLAAIEDQYRERVLIFVEGDKGPKNLHKIYDQLRIPLLLHGDFRNSNLLYKMLPNDKCETTIIDYQTMLPGSPAGDLLYFLFLGSDEGFRRDYWDQILDHYYTELSTHLRRFKLDPDKIFTREEWDYEVKEKLPFGLSVAILILPVILMEEGAAPSINKLSDFKQFAVKSSNAYPERLNGIIRDFIRWKII